ncbi:Single-stranded DNA-binding protein 2 [Homalodisca vitripennis]|nr:Single-stranded DNA-binding protein 2 [Homalodisca vitripennis]
MRQTRSGSRVTSREAGVERCTEGRWDVDFPMSGGPEGGSLGPMGPSTMGPVMNGDGIDGMKNSPANGGPGTPREDSGSGMGDYNLGGFGPGENVSMASAGYFSEPKLSTKEEW